MALSFKPVRPLLQTGSNTASRWFSYLGLGIGVLLLLCSIQMFVNLQQLLGEKVAEKGGYDYIAISKTITNETMGKPEKNMFSEKEIEEIKSQPFIEDVAPLLANNFRFVISGGSLIPFESDFYLESLDKSFIDTVPPNFSWSQGQSTVPVIVASDFLEIYNVWAPSYGLPQISEATTTNISLMFICYYSDGSHEVFRGKIAALSDRVNSIIVPPDFLEWANKRFGNNQPVRASRLFVKTKDANSTEFLHYLTSKNYRVNKDKTRLGRVKIILQGIFTGLGFYGLMVVVMALLLFSFYLQLMIARSRENLQLLLTLGYSPRWLSNKVLLLFVPVYVLIVLCALALTQGMHWAFHHFVMYDRPELSVTIHWTVALVAAMLILLSLLTNYRLVKKLLHQLY